MDDQLFNSLIELGFTDKEAKIYLALLSLGSASPAEVAKKSNVVRSTAYVVLETLEQRGLVERSPKGKSVFAISDPERMVNLVEDRAKLARSIYPILSAQLGNDRSKPSIRFYEGTKGVLRVYDEWLKLAQQPNAPKSVVFYGSLSEIQKQFAGVLERCYAVWESKGFEVKELIGDTEFEKEFAKKHGSAKRIFRHIKSPQKFTIDFGIYGSNVVLFQLSKNPFALLIESSDVAESLRGLYDLAWLGADSTTLS